MHLEDTVISEILEGRDEPTPTKTDCIKLIDDLESSDEIEEPDDENYRLCCTSNDRNRNFQTSHLQQRM